MRGPFDGSWTGGGGTGKARVTDLSLGGCYIDALNPQRPGDPIQLDIALPEGVVSATGAVVYAVPNQGYAVRFVGLPSEAEDVLRRAVERLVSEGQGV